MNAFLTGSHAYGMPHDKSDIDLVVLVEQPLSDFLSEHLGELTQEDYKEGVSIRSGKLNLICLTDKNKFNLWRKATSDLTIIRPVTREKAIAYHQQRICGTEDEL